jgi:hypothetical protein
MLPPALHLLQSAFVRCIALCNRILQMFVLRLYDLIRRVSMVREITWPTQLFTRHCLHESRFRWSVAKTMDVVKFMEVILGYLGGRLFSIPDRFGRLFRYARSLSLAEIA